MWISIDFIISKDASLLGWGASLYQATTVGRGGKMVQRGTETPYKLYLELIAVQLGLQSLCGDFSIVM